MIFWIFLYFTSTTDPYSVVTKDSACSSKVTVGNALKLMIEEDVDAFVGPPCSVGQCGWMPLCMSLCMCGYIRMFLCMCG